MLLGKKKKNLISKEEQLQRAIHEIHSAQQNTLERLCASLDVIRECVRDEHYLELLNKSSKPEAETRRALIDPFLNAFGYNANDLRIVCGEKKVSIDKHLRAVDYAITHKNATPADDPQTFSPILVEAKASRVNLDRRDGRLYPVEQLAEYFDNVPEAQLGILTNGIIYRFFGCDAAAALSGQHKMASIPFLELDISSPEVKMPSDFVNLEYDSFDLSKIASYLYTLKAPTIERMKSVSLKGEVLAAVRQAADLPFKIYDDTFIEWFDEAMAEKLTK